MTPLIAQTAIGIDLGGTNLKGGVVDDTGRVLLKRSQPAPPKDSSADEIVASLVGLTRELRRESEALGLQPEGVGLGVPNFIEGPDWIQRQVNNLPGLNDFAIRPPLTAALGERVAIDNDVMNAGLAEYYFGGAHVYDRVFFFAIGTGIAASIFIEGGERLRYVLGWPGDTGHIIVDPLGRRCTCGGRGCLETVAAGPAIREQALSAAVSGQSPALAARLQAAGDLEASDVTAAAIAGDAGARKLWEQVGWYIGMALTSYQHIYDPHLVLIGGGVSQAGELLLESIRRTMAELGSPYYLKHLQAIKQASLGADAGLIGAAALILLPEAVR